MMAPLPRFLVFLLGVAVLLVVINLVRRRTLQERYAILWLLAGVVLTLSPVFIPLLDHLAFSMGFEYPPALLLLLVVVGLLLITFQLSLTLSRSEERIKQLTQELAILRQQMELLKLSARQPSAAKPTERTHDEPDTDFNNT